MNLFITGASGYIGGSVAWALRERGVHIRGLTRTADSAERLRHIGIDPVIGSLDDAALLAREAAAADGVINAAHADHAGAVHALIAALEGSGKPLLHTSGSSVVGDDAHGETQSAQVFSDDGPLVVHPAKQARRDIDVQVLGAAERGVRSCVVCPTLIYGRGRGLNPHSVQLPFLAENARQQGAVQIVGAGRNVWSTVHIDDVVELFRLALIAAPAGAFYFAENGEVSFADIGTALGQRLGLGVQSLAADTAAHRWGEARAYFSFGSNSRVRGLRARRELGWSPVHPSVIAWIGSELPITGPSAPAN